MKDNELENEIAKLREELASVKKQCSFLKTALDNLPNPIFLKDENARFVFFNSSYSKQFGMEPEKYLGKCVLDLNYLHENDRERFHKEDVEVIRSSSILSYEVDFDFSDGYKHPCLYWTHGFFDKAGGQRGLVGEIVDISKERIMQRSLEQLMEELKKANADLGKIMKIDESTGIYNRVMLHEKIKELENQKEKLVRTCALMADIDHFKKVNDIYGHIKGDEILAWVANILKRECRSDDTPIRYGGEEFLLLLSNATLETGIAVAERIRKRCENEIKLPNGEPVTISIGVALMKASLNFEENINMVDQYLYKAKEQGRNRVCAEVS